MSRKISFTEYVTSKEQLMDAIKQDPVVDTEYSVIKYCKLPVGESANNKEYVTLRPKMTLKVTWRYINECVDADVHEMDRVPMRISIVDNESESSYDLFQSDDRLTKWIHTNARKVNNG